MLFLYDIKAIPFLQELISHLPEGSQMSLEGELDKHLMPEIPYSTVEEGIYTRNTLVPVQDFWLFEIDEHTRSYLMNDLLHKVGIRKHVLHIHIGYDEQLIFASYDNLLEDHVVFKPGPKVGEPFLKEMKHKGLISSFEKIRK
jgi:hypothetical protein